MNDQNPQHQQGLIHRNTQLSNLNEVDATLFLAHFPDAGLVSSFGYGFPIPFLKFANSLLQSSDATQTTGELTHLDQLLLDGLDMVADLLDQGIGDDRALALILLQKWVLALEALEDELLKETLLDQNSSTLHRCVFDRLQELESTSSLLPLNDEVVSQIKSWSQSYPPLPETHRLRVFDETLDAVELGLILQLEKHYTDASISSPKEPRGQLAAGFISGQGIGQESIESLKSYWPPNKRYSADSDDDHGNRWDIVEPATNTPIGCLFNDGRGFWSFETNRDLISVTLDGVNLTSDPNDPHDWTAQLSTKTIPQTLRVQFLDSGKPIDLKFHRKYSDEDDYQ